MADSERRSLLLWPVASISDSNSDSDSAVLEEEKFRSTSGGLSNDDIPMPIPSADLEDEASSNEDMSTLLFPARAAVGDGRHRRSRLWSSVQDKNQNLRRIHDSIEERRDERREAKVAGKKVVVKSDETWPLLLSKSDTDSEVQTSGIHALHLDKAPGNKKSEIKGWLHRAGQRTDRGITADRLSELLSTRSVSTTTNMEMTTREIYPSGATGERRISPLNLPPVHRRPSIAVQVSERVPPEWVLLLLGCLLGLSSGVSVVGFNKAVHIIHELAWAGTPHEGAAWLRTQKLADTWHRILLIPLVGGVVVGMFHFVSEIMDMIQASQPHPANHRKINWLAAIKPVIKALQAAITLGTGLSLGPEGPSVDIGKSWAHGYSEILKSSTDRRIALVAAGAAAGIASGFNAPVAGTFFAIETVLRPQHAENSPPLTTAMIILAAVISSTVSQVLLGERPAFTVPPYELRSAAELPLYILLGAICGIMSVVFTRLVTWFTHVFDFVKVQLGISIAITPAIGGLLAGTIALRYPGVLYWGFTNVDEILKSGFTATAPGQGLLAQLTIAKIVATALCKGSGLVGGLYAPSLFIGSAGGAVYGSIIGKAINAALPGHNAVAHPQAYALVGMAALLASVCSVPLTSVLLLFELTKDYHILLPLMGAVGLAIWVAAIGNQKQPIFKDAVAQQSFKDYGVDLLLSDNGWHQAEGSGSQIELCASNYDDLESVFFAEETLMEECHASQAMAKSFVKVSAMATVKETLGLMLAIRQRFALVVDENDLLEGIMTITDLERVVLRAIEDHASSGGPKILEVDTMLVVAICSGLGDGSTHSPNLVVCYPDTNLRAAEELMQPHDLLQLPVVIPGGTQWQGNGCKVVGVLHRESIPVFIKAEASKRMAALLTQKIGRDDPSKVCVTN